jgi:hypothetical protein
VSEPTTQQPAVRPAVGRTKACVVTGPEGGMFPPHYWVVRAAGQQKAGSGVDLAAKSLVELDNEVCILPWIRDRIQVLADRPDAQSSSAQTIFQEIIVLLGHLADGQASPDTLRELRLTCAAHSLRVNQPEVSPALLEATRLVLTSLQHFAGEYEAHAEAKPPPL